MAAPSGREGRDNASLAPSGATGIAAPALKRRLFATL